MTISKSLSKRIMKRANDEDARLRLKSKISFIEKELSSLDNYLPETYNYLMNELDGQKRLLAELEVKTHFSNIDNDQEMIDEKVKA